MMRTMIVAVILGYVGLALALTAFMIFAVHTDLEILGHVSEQINERDRRQYTMQNRLLRLEEQRDLERRLTDVEEQLRTFCTGSKLDMCGKVGPTR